MTNPVVAELVELLGLERLEDNLFRGQSRDIGTRYVFGSKGQFALRYVEPRDDFTPGKPEPIQRIWFRLVDRIDYSPTLHRAMVAYASDFSLIGTAMVPHGISWLTGKVQLASLDHAMWFHRPFRADEWLLYSFDSPTAQGARGLARGQIFSADGRLVASTAQEGMMRLASSSDRP